MERQGEEVNVASNWCRWRGRSCDAAIALLLNAGRRRKRLQMDERTSGSTSADLEWLTVTFSTPQGKQVKR